MRTLMETPLAHHTGKDPAVIRKDTDRDKILTAEEAKQYGIIDTVLEYRKLSAQTAWQAPSGRLFTGPLATCVRQPNSRRCRMRYRRYRLAVPGNTRR